MADEISKRDVNSITVGLAVTDDAAQDIVQIRVDPTTKALIVQQNAVIDTPKIFEDTSFVLGDSPATLDVNAALGRNATEFTVINDGAGDFTVSISNDGVAFGDEHTMKNGETYSIENISVDSIRITHVADSAYRVVAI